MTTRVSWTLRISWSKFIQRNHSSRCVKLGPCFRGTRVPVQTLLDFLETGETVDAFVAVYPYIPRSQVLAFFDLTALGAGQTRKWTLRGFSGKSLCFRGRQVGDLPHLNVKAAKWGGSLTGRVLKRACTLLCQSLLQIRDDVFRRFDADRDSHQTIADPQPRAMLRRQIAVRGHRGVENHGVNVAERGCADDHF